MGNCLTSIPVVDIPLPQPLLVVCSLGAVLGVMRNILGDVRHLRQGLVGLMVPGRLTCSAPHHSPPCHPHLPCCQGNMFCTYADRHILGADNVSGPSSCIVAT